LDRAAPRAAAGGHDAGRLLTYARIESALADVRKVDEAKEFLAARTPNLHVEPYPCPFASFKRELGRRRQNRRYDVVITGLDNDPARHEVQRELPRVLIDGASRRDANVTVERVLLGEWGCLGCTRQGDGAAADGNCDELPDTRAPSVSFLSNLPGILACGELAKEALGGGRGSPRGVPPHLHLGPNEDMLIKAAPTETCRIECTRGACSARTERRTPTRECEPSWRRCSGLGRSGGKILEKRGRKQNARAGVYQRREAP
jgi:hypothetical protein